MPRVRVQRTVRARSDNRRDWCKRTEIVNFLGRFRGLNTDTRTKASSCAREALAEGLPMTEFLRARRDLTLIGVAMEKVIGRGGRPLGCGVTQRCSGSFRSQGGPPDPLHLDLRTARKIFRKMTSWSRRSDTCVKSQSEKHG